MLVKTSLIDPANATDFFRSEYQLEEFLLFGILAAGKKSIYIVPMLEDFLKREPQGDTPSRKSASWNRKEPSSIT